MPSAGRADLLLVNGRILTMARKPARALALSGDRILAIGGEDVLSLRGPRTRLIDLEGRLALPGFTDSHLHLAGLARRLSELDLTRAQTLAEAQRAVRARAHRTPPGKWITGCGLDKNRWGGAFPNRHHLDEVAPDNPVALTTRDGHSLWVNSLALKRCGIGPRARAPAGGRILRDSRGYPSGILLEAATRLVDQSPGFARARAVPSSSNLVRALRSLLRLGITSVHLMEEAPLLHPLQDLRESGDLCLRVTLYRSREALDDLLAAGIRSGFGDEWLRIGGVKLLLDGTLGSQTAWLFRPYQNSDAGCGIPLLRLDELRDCVRRASAGGLACAIHAIGDRANAEALTALAQVQHSPTPLPHRVEHAQLLRRADIPRFARLGAVASMQPCHILGDIDPAERYWGSRCRWAYPISTLLRSGAALAFGSDAPVETANPIAGVYAAVNRQTIDGRPLHGWYRREEGIRCLDALRAYTVGPAGASGEAELKGKLLPGYLADIVVLSDDITRQRGKSFLDAKVEFVIVGGRLKYRRRRAGARTN